MRGSGIAVLMTCACVAGVACGIATLVSRVCVAGVACGALTKSILERNALVKIRIEFGIIQFVTYLPVLSKVCPLCQCGL